MIHTGKFYRAELYEDNKWPYTNVSAVYKANKDRFPGKKLVVTNGHWVEGTKPCAWYRINGAWLATTDGLPKDKQYSCYGLTWDTTDGKTEKPEWTVVGPTLATANSKDNFVCTIPVFMNGYRQEYWWHPDGVKRQCNRTWWGFNQNGDCFIEVTETGYTLDAIVDRMESLGIVDGLVLDGSGGSQWCDSRTWYKGSDGRVIYEYLLLWFDEEDKETSTKMKICLDPGHGGNELTNGSSDGKFKEHEFTLDLATRIKPLLEKQGIQVVMTRTNHTTVVNQASRAEIANANKVDAMVSIHTNAVPATSLDSSGWCSSARGLVAFTYGPGETLARNKLANALITRFKEAGVVMFSQPLMYSKGITVLVNTDMPACLIEYGFHTNKVDTELLKDSTHRDQLALATAKGICDWCGIKYVESTAPTPTVTKTLEERVAELEKRVETLERR